MVSRRSGTRPASEQGELARPQATAPSARRAEAGPGPLLEGALLLTVLAGAAFLRLYQLDALPPGLDLDEARNGVEVLRVLAGNHPLFFTAFDPREPAFIYSLTLAVKAMGHTVMAMRVTAACWGLLGVGLTYAVARQWFGRTVALLACAGMAGSLWDLAMSRWAERDITLLPPLLLFLLFLWRGFERRSVPSLALAGVFASLCAYAYVAARILPVLIALIVAGQWLLARKSVSDCRGGLLAGMAAAAATIAPLAVYFALHPSVFFGRISQINSLGAPLPGLAPESVWQTAANTLGMFFVRGDVNWRDNVAGQPVFPWWAAAFFCLGIVWAAARAIHPAGAIRQALGAAGSQAPAAGRLFPCLWLLLWQATLLVPAFLARPSPQYDRTIGAAPSTYILLALGLTVSGGWLRRWAGRGAWAAATAAPAVLAVNTYQAYFRVYPNAAEPRHVFQYGQVEDARVLNQRRPPPDSTVLFLGAQSSLAVRYLAPQYEAATWLEDFSQLIPVPPSGPVTFVLAQPSLPTNGDLPSIVQRYFPDATLAGKASFLNGDQAGRVFEVSDGQMRTFRGAERRIDADFGGKLSLDSVSPAERRLTIRPAEEVRLGLSWRVTAPSHDNYAAFVHVVNGDGNVVAQDDRQGLPTGGWRAGQQVLSLHVFRLPPGASPGVYRVLAGVDRRTIAQPSQSLGEIGPQVTVLELEVPG